MSSGTASARPARPSAPGPPARPPAGRRSSSRQRRAGRRPPVHRAEGANTGRFQRADTAGAGARGESTLVHIGGERYQGGVLVREGSTLVHTHTSCRNSPIVRPLAVPVASSGGGGGGGGKQLSCGRGRSETQTWGQGLGRSARGAVSQFPTQRSTRRTSSFAIQPRVTAWYSRRLVPCDDSAGRSPASQPRVAPPQPPPPQARARGTRYASRARPRRMQGRPRLESWGGGGVVRRRGLAVAEPRFHCGVCRAMISPAWFAFRPLRVTQPNGMLASRLATPASCRISSATVISPLPFCANSGQ